MDRELVRRGLSDDLESARAAIRAGSVLVGGAVATNAARQVRADEPVRLDAPARYVSRGGDKLAAALERFALDVTGARALDAGASTGGFTDCLLQHGAAEVIAVDTGSHQLHERIRGDARVTVHEQTNVRDLGASRIGGPVDLVVADVSFTSLRPLIPTLVELCVAGGDLVLLVKPQFEATRDEADRGQGVIRDPAIWQRTLTDVRDALHGARAAIMGGMPSPIRGRHGNVEFLLHARTQLGAANRLADDGAWIDALVADVGSPS